MINLDEVVRQLLVNAEVIATLVQGLSDEQAQWMPAPETWSMKEVMEHLYNEERIDFRKHLKEMLNDPPLPWGEFRRDELISTASCKQALAGFLAERKDSIAWLRALEAPDWDAQTSATFGPENETLTFHAGDVMFSWVAHDHLHLRQVNELLYAWNNHQAAPYSVHYAGGW